MNDVTLLEFKNFPTPEGMSHIVVSHETQQLFAKVATDQYAHRSEYEALQRRADSSAELLRQANVDKVTLQTQVNVLKDALLETIAIIAKSDPEGVKKWLASLPD